MIEKTILILSDVPYETWFIDPIDTQVALSFLQIKSTELDKFEKINHEDVLVSILHRDYMIANKIDLGVLFKTYQIFTKSACLLIGGEKEAIFLKQFRSTLYHYDTINMPIESCLLANKIRILLEIEKNKDEINHLHDQITDLNSQLSRANHQLRKTERHDIVTGLSNRVDFNEFLNIQIQKSKRYERLFAVLFMDLDNFKTVNDSYGHLIGDMLLKHVGALIQECIRGTDFLVRRKSDVKISRFGGDEFAIILSEIETIENAGIVANRILRALQEPIKLGEGIEVLIGMSIGIACYPFAGETINEMSQSADMAMYDAKRLGKNTYCFYSEELSIARSHHIMIEAKLREAMKANKFYLLYQPIVNLRDSKVIGIEALCRCDLKTLYGVQTRELIEIAEKTGLIHNLGSWVLQQLMRETNDYIYTQYPDIKIHFNVSTKQLQEKTFYEQILALKDEHKMNMSRFVIELTETAIHPDARGLTDSIKKFSNLGIETSIDDFGQGNASLIWLKYLDISSLKIDHEFIADLVGNKNDAIITKSIIRLAENLELKAIAEGIESKEQLDFLLHHHCYIGQGHYFSPPLRINHLIDYLEKK